VSVNEGPQPLIRNGRVFVVFSASGCWTDAYALGMIWADARANLLDPKSWTKLAEPVFSAAVSKPAGTFAAGHNSFYQSPDGKTDYLLYHANAKPGQGCGGFRSPRSQPFTWTPSGFPLFGSPEPVN
jgi:GH43 family beta-xylosidase